jgi:hypothetical protein
MPTEIRMFAEDPMFVSVLHGPKQCRVVSLCEFRMMAPRPCAAPDGNDAEVHIGSTIRLTLPAELMLEPLGGALIS